MRSPSARPEVTTARSPIAPSVRRPRISTRESPVTTYANGPAGPFSNALDGMVSAPCSVRTRTRTFTNSPGQRVLCAFVERRLETHGRSVWSILIVDQRQTPRSSSVCLLPTSACRFHASRRQTHVLLNPRFLGQSKHDRDRLHLSNDDDAGGVGHVHVVAGVYQPDSGAPINERSNRGVG